MDIVRTRSGWRLSQHGVVISELRTTPGPTHSVFDFLAALLAVLDPPGRIGMLGFAGGGVIAPLVGLGWDRTLDTVDLDASAFAFFQQYCPTWQSRVRWKCGDAVDWLRHQPQNFAALIEDLSQPRDGSVYKPAVSWNQLPRLLRGRLQRGGIAIFNVILEDQDRWPRALAQLAEGYSTARVIRLDDFHNRLLIAGAELPSANVLSRRLHTALRALRSRQATRFQVATL